MQRKYKGHMPVAVTHIIYFDETDERAPLSGTENHLLDLMKGLSKTGVEVELIALIRRHNMRLDNMFLDLDRHNITVTQLHLGDIFSGWDLFKTLYKFCVDRRNRVIHTHLPLASFYGRIAAVLARCAGVVQSWHNDDPADAEGLRRIQWLFLNVFTRTTIAVSDNVRNFLINSVGLGPEKIETVYYGIRSPDLLIPKEEARKHLDIPQDHFCVGFVGKLTRQKNIPLLFEAVKDMHNVTLCIIGSGEEEDYLKKRADNMGVKNCIFAGGRDQAADLMTAFNLMVLPSRWEGLGLVLLEAMIRHVPVAGSKNGAIPETLGMGKRGFLFDSAEELRLIILNMTQKPLYAVDKEITAYQDVLSRYTIHAMVDKTKKIYQSIIADPTTT
jgi:glycosyltransferase involved in cell wall biosynthesis